MDTMIPYELRTNIILFLCKDKSLLDKIDLMKLFLNNNDTYMLNQIGKTITVYTNVISITYYSDIQKYITVKPKIDMMDELGKHGSIDEMNWWLNSGLYVYYSYNYLDNILLYKNTNVLYWLINEKKLNLIYKYAFYYACHNGDKQGILWFLKLHNDKIIKKIYADNEILMKESIKLVIDAMDWHTDTLFFKRVLIYIIRNDMFVYDDDVLEALIMYGDDNLLVELMKKHEYLKFKKIIEINYDTDNKELKKWIEKMD